MRPSFQNPILSAPGRSAKIHFSGNGLPAPLGESEICLATVPSLNERGGLLEEETAGNTKERKATGLTHQDPTPFQASV